MRLDRREVIQKAAGMVAASVVPGGGKVLL